MRTTDHSIHSGYGRERAANRASGDDEGMRGMDIIEEHKKTARRLSRENGTSHQSELNNIAKKNGHHNWGSYLIHHSADPSQNDRSILAELPSSRRELEKYAEDLSLNILSLQPIIHGVNHEKNAHKSLTGLILAEICCAHEEGRPASITSLRGWLTASLETAGAKDEEDRKRANEEGQIYLGDSHRAFFVDMARKVNVSQPYGRAYAEMTKMASMAPAERFQILMDIIPALSDYIDGEFEKAS